MNKKIIIIILTILLIGIISFTIYKVLNKKDTSQPTSNYTPATTTSNNGFKVFSISEINITNPKANLIFLDDIDGTGQEELEVIVGDTYSFQKAWEQTIEVLELNDNYITISTKGLAPTKETGGFSLIDKYDKVTIKKNTGICLNVQATDLVDGSVYFFYVSQ